MSLAPPPAEGLADTPQPSRRRLLIAGLVALALVAGGITAAVLFFVVDIGADDTPKATPLEVYFRRVANVINAVDDQSSQPVESPDGALLQFALVLADAVEGLKEIEPLPEAADAHQRLIAAEDEAAQRFQRLFEERDLTSIDEVNEILATDEIVLATGARATQACSELLQLATENDISVRLELC